MSEIDPHDGHRSWADVVQLTRLMQEERGPVLERMRQIELRYDGDYVIPLPERPDEPEQPLTSPSLMGELIDGLSQRAAAVPFSVGVPALNGQSQTSLKKAARRRDAIRASYHRSKFDLVRRTYYRHLTAYHTFTLLVIPDWTAKMPRVESRSPLTTFAESRSRDEMRPPEYVAFISTRSAQWLRATYPHARAEHGGPITDAPTTANQQWDIVEWFDCTHRRYGILGPSNRVDHTTTNWGYSSLNGPVTNIPISDPIPHYTKVCPVVAPEMPSLGKIAARLSALTGMIDMADKLSALDVEAQLRSVFPDTYIIGDGQSNPSLVDETWHDGASGQVNIIKDAKSVGVLRSTPDGRTGQMVDRFERNFRVSTGLAGQMSGENSHALRTGRAIDSLGAAAIDPRIAEMHDMTSNWLPHVQELQLRMFKEYWPSRTYSLYTGDVTKSGQTQFIPKRDCDDPEYLTAVSYPVPGADMIQLTQVLGSLAGANAISQETMRELHPWIKSPESERNQIFAEKIEQSLVESLMQRAQAGAIPLDVARQVLDELRSSGDISKAIKLVEEKLREIQAAAAQAPPEGMQAAPETMPGLEGGPMANQTGSAVAPPGEVSVPPNVQRMRQLQAAMSGGQ